MIKHAYLIILSNEDCQIVPESFIRIICFFGFIWFSKLYWNWNFEGRTFPGFWFNFNAATHKIDKALGYWKTQSCSGVRPVEACLSLAEPVKNNRDQLFINTDASIGNRKIKGLILPWKIDLNGACICEFDSVAHKIIQYLRYFSLICSQDLIPNFIWYFNFYPLFNCWSWIDLKIIFKKFAYYELPGK